MSIKDCIHQGLSTAYHEIDNEGQELIEKIKANYSIANCKPIFDKPFQQNNIMCKCKLSCVQDREVKIRLSQLNRVQDNMFFDKKALPSLLMCLPTFAPVVLCSFKGRITMTGGNSLEEIQYCLTYYCSKLIYYLKIIYPPKDFFFEDFSICNRLCTSRLPYNIDLFTCSIDIISLSQRNPLFAGFRVKYSQEQINLLYIFPPAKLFGSSLRISIGSEGGINIFGAKKDYEIKAMAYLLTILLQSSVRVKYLEQLNREREEHNQAVKYTKLLRKKSKLITKWQTLTGIKPPDQNLPPDEDIMLLAE